MDRCLGISCFNSTIRRRSTIENLFAQHVPYFRLDDAIAVAFINEVEALVRVAIERAKERLRSPDRTGSPQFASPASIRTRGDVARPVLPGNRPAEALSAEGDVRIVEILDPRGLHWK